MRKGEELFHSIYSMWTLKRGVVKKYVEQNEKIMLEIEDLILEYISDKYPSRKLVHRSINDIIFSLIRTRVYSEFKDSPEPRADAFKFVRSQGGIIKRRFIDFNIRTRRLYSYIEFSKKFFESKFFINLVKKNKSLVRGFEQDIPEEGQLIMVMTIIMEDFVLGRLKSSTASRLRKMMIESADSLMGSRNHLYFLKEYSDGRPKIKSPSSEAILFKRLLYEATIKTWDK